MLGSSLDAEDVVQEAFLRWSQVEPGTVSSPKAYLSAVVTRLSIDQLRSARVQRISPTDIRDCLPEARKSFRCRAPRPANIDAPESGRAGHRLLPESLPLRGRHHIQYRSGALCPLLSRCVLP